MSGGQPISGHKGRDEWMCAILARDTLSLLEVRVAVRLAIFFNCKSGKCDPGYDTLMSELRMSRRTLYRGIAGLKANGWIEVRRLGIENVQFSLFIPPDGGASMLAPDGGATTLAPPEPSLQVPENGGTGANNGGVKVPHRLAAHKNLLTCEPEIAAEGGGYHTSRADRESASSSTSSDARLNQRAPGGALIETVEAKQQPSSATAMGTGPATDADPAFAEVYQRGREVLGNDADAVITELLAAHDGYVDAALDTLAVAEEESDPRQYVQTDIETEAAARRQRK
ncbi:helix-turn-helix domain-containing protein [Bradyrhizobium japonicum]|uniref:helix-turn-helix domain-containing protein n=1 Tax=Bradyrhizobium japonicum TaxID=375 RepID=UPI001E522431|nr:helix-turn-helix domain-containing protein [Bradyrhizobium japonicum]MCD9821621.1 helix-turn-helix domain-containing protein [Bradyrhizobium japonicum]MEB2678420.1 helix-turn-helix domain-containing protein [Bradyrhizobium japonicum]WRI88656.1 helix-turn-helix domain-containing protein [Bradyrhizobium japonicum]